jgi:hypothetical protein
MAGAGRLRSSSRELASVAATKHPLQRSVLAGRSRGEGMTPEPHGRSESFRLTAINASIWSVKALELPD